MRNLFIVSVSGLLILITVLVSLLIAVNTQNEITAEVRERQSDLRDEVSGMARSETLAAIPIAVIGGLILIACLSALAQFVVVRPLHKMISTIRGVAEGEGDLTVRFNSTASNELGQMAHEFDQLLDRLQATISETKNSSTSLLAASGELKTIASDSAVQA